MNRVSKTLCVVLLSANSASAGIVYHSECSPGWSPQPCWLTKADCEPAVYEDCGCEAVGSEQVGGLLPPLFPFGLGALVGGSVLVDRDSDNNGLPPTFPPNYPPTFPPTEPPTGPPINPPVPPVNPPTEPPTDNPPVVPEPSSLAVFSTLAVVGSVIRLRRKPKQ